MKRVRLLVRYGHYEGELAATQPPRSWAARLCLALAAVGGLIIALWHRAR